MGFHFGIVKIVFSVANSGEAMGGGGPPAHPPNPPDKT